MKQRLNENDERKESELLVFIKAKDLSAYILLISGKSPVKYRYSLLNPLINNSLEIIELLYEANELELKDIRRLELIRKARAILKTIDFLSSIAKDASCFTTHQHDVILEKIGVCSKYLQGYYNSCKKALNI
ncbi:MAG: four helix bundle protein [Candidatus Onthovivens sp.]|nr:four helix bundle protein [Candidatus Onthovivens sp.]MDY4849289.1 four helix bundle protein [Bacilli bacterium]